jgi:DNA-binding SARP family transcriptional activator
VGVDLRIWLLGGFRVTVDGSPVADGSWRRNKAKAIVKLLALASGHRLHREQLMDLLWPDLAPEAAASNLRKAVYFARQALAPEHVRVHGEMLGLEAPRLWIDVEAFEAAAEAADVKSAVELYGGDLLPEDRFEPWTEERRDQLHAWFARRLLERARELEAAGDVHAAVAALERLAAVDPLSEEAAIGVIRAHALAGQRHLALRWYRQLETRLADELGVEPGAEARQLYEAIAAGRFPPAAEPPVVAAPPARPTAADSGIQASEERKLVTVVLLDVTAPSTATDPERTRLELDRYAGPVAEVLESWGGTAERVVGGSVLAVFGVPTAHEDDADRALRAALELLERSPLPVRIGVGTGEVITPAGTGADPREIAGAVLEVAARLREEAQPGTVLADERTCRVAGAAFEFGAPARLAHGGGLELRAHCLVGLASGASPAQPRLQGPIIGRDAELGVLLSLFDEVIASGQPRLLNMVGSAGVGKSRLVAEGAAAMAARRPDMLVLRGRCPSAGRGITYWALGEILREACGVSLADPLATSQDRCSKGLREILGRLGSAGDLDATVFALAASGGVNLPGSTLDRLEPKAVAAELASAWPRFATACASAGPALLVVEDLHWAGAELLETLELTVARATGPLLVLTTARPELAEAHPGFGGQAGEAFASISLRPLTDVHSRELLASLTSAGRLPAGRGEEVLARAEGNPLFLEELVLHLAGAGAGALPDSLQALLAARIDALSTADKRVLQQAAVVGRVFWEDPVRRALDVETVAAVLGHLERRGFVVRRPASSLPGQAELSFRHALIHDVAYRSLPKVRRARAHAEVGAWLEELAGGRRDEFAELLAYHFGAAAAEETAELAWPEPAVRRRVRAKAFDHLLRAGTAARRRFAVAKAVELHEQAGALAGTERERRRVLEELGDDQSSAYHGDEAVGWWVRALASARADRSGGADRARLCRKLAWVMADTPGAFRSSPDPALVDQFVTEGFDAAEDAVGRAWLLLARGISARLWRGSGPFEQGTQRDPVPIGERIADVEQALAAGEAADLPELVGAAMSALRVLYGVAGRYQEVLTLGRRELDRLAGVGSRLEQAEILRTVSVLTITISARFEEGLDLARRSHALSVDASPHQRMHATWPLMAALYHLGRWSELLPTVDEHVAAFSQDPAVLCHLVRDGPVIGATVLAHRGELERARRLAAMVGEPMHDLDSASAWQALFATASGDPETARQLSADKAQEPQLYGPQHALALLEALVALEDWPSVGEFLPLARARVAGNALLAPACDRAEGLTHARSGRPDEAVWALRRALARFERLGVAFEAARTREHLAALEPPTAARPLLDAALLTYQRLDCTPRQHAVQARLLTLA